MRSDFPAPLTLTRDEVAQALGWFGQTHELDPMCTECSPEQVDIADRLPAGMPSGLPDGYVCVYHRLALFADVNGAGLLDIPPNAMFSLSPRDAVVLIEKGGRIVPDDHCYACNDRAASDLVCLKHWLKARLNDLKGARP